MGGSRRADTNSPANLLMLCGSGTTGCHGWVEGHRAEARTAGLIVSQWDDPEAVPYRDGGGRIWILHADGTRTPPVST
jgi:hypothetical protein